MKCITCWMGARVLQDIVDDPTLQLFQREIRHANHSSTGAPRHALFQIKELVLIARAASHDIPQMQKRNVG